ncbi:MAG TPA: hypothetical protein VIO94_16540 [Phenylobacterium sp.]
MPGTSFDSDANFDPQDQAEALDDTNFSDEEENSELRTFEELPDVLDVTQVAGDRDDDEALALDADEFDEEAFGDEDTEEDNELDYRAKSEDEDDIYDDEDSNDIVDDFDEDAAGDQEIEGLMEVRDAGAVEGGEDDFTNFQAKNVGDEDLRRMGYIDDADNPGADPSRRG